MRGYERFIASATNAVLVSVAVTAYSARHCPLATSARLPDLRRAASAQCRRRDPPVTHVVAANTNDFCASIVHHAAGAGHLHSAPAALRCSCTRQRSKAMPWRPWKHSQRCCTIRVDVMLTQWHTSSAPGSTAMWSRAASSVAAHHGANVRPLPYWIRVIDARDSIESDALSLKASAPTEHGRPAAGAHVTSSAVYSRCRGRRARSCHLFTQ